MIGVDPLDDASSPQRLQSADVTLDMGLVVATRNAEASGFGHNAMCARMIVAGVSRKLGDITIRGTRAFWRRRNLDNRANLRLFDCRRLSHRDMMDPAIDAVDNEAEALTELVGQPLADHPSDTRRASLLAVQDIAAKCPLFATGCERAIDRFDDVAALAQVAQRRLQFFR
jgi:hypothetical protein